MGAPLSESPPESHSLPLSADDACAMLDVSRETQDRLETYVGLLTHWQGSINLVGAATLVDVWRRHILDSGQIFRHLAHPHGRIMDIGSGAGLPGLVLAIMGAGRADEPLILVESDKRKCAFLSVAAEHCGVGVMIKDARLESLPPLLADTITARAVAPLERLLSLTGRQQHPGLQCLFMKGRRADQELTCLTNYPNIKVETAPSLSNPDGVILKLNGFATAPGHDDHDEGRI